MTEIGEMTEVEGTTGKNFNPASFNMIEVPSFKSILAVGGGAVYHLLKERPNWWWRSWQWVFCGFVWAKVE